MENGAAKRLAKGVKCLVECHFRMSLLIWQMLFLLSQPIVYQCWFVETRGKHETIQVPTKCTSLDRREMVGVILFFIHYITVGSCKGLAVDLFCYHYYTCL